ncbi:hypothetical protein QNI16_07795 [Cytophagaceae bacterium YF14B1]|uniref:Uncharacterized protein n=1 Tax=Xanthocytophaga flava TaxID=3048013 RepID=A0AAE3QJB1_9BACT|nr:hypothetical protein [Xanthocytophaga flavus]MDJ1480382.1 hypothetical protein [Xanthocytophaga flavus]
MGQDKGITLGGKRHAQGGTKILIEGQGMIEAEKGEVLTIVKRSDSAKLSALSQTNVARGGVSFMEQGDISTIGAAITANAGSQLVKGISFDYVQFAKVLEQMPAPITRLTDIERVQGNKNRVVNKGNIRPIKRG